MYQSSDTPCRGFGPRVRIDNLDVKLLQVEVQALVSEEMSPFLTCAISVAKLLANQRV